MSAASTQGKVIRCKAAVAWQPDQPLSIEEIEVDPPKANEVRIKIMATGVCHTDAYTLSGKDPEGVFPCVLGHEGGGIVESVGEGVTSVKPGDHVIPLYIPECKTCKFCTSGKTNLCSRIRETQGQGLMPDRTSRFRCKGQVVYHYMGCSTFSEYTVVAEISCCVVPTSLPLSKLCLLGCGIPTGVGAALKNVQKCDTVAIFGLGCVGLSVAQGCKLANAKQVIGIDRVPSKEKIGQQFGIDTFLDASKLSLEDLRKKLIEMTDGGVDVSFECVGNTQLMRLALEVCHKGWGTSVIIGVAGAGAEISTRPFQLVTGRTWKGSAFGGYKSRSELPTLVQAYQDGKLKIDEYITHHFPLQDINQAFDAMHSGNCIRSIINF